MKIFEQIQKTREYLNYIEEHVKNVQKAWTEIQEKCNDMFFIQNDSYYEDIGTEVQGHDLSKMSESEFIQYRKAFYPTCDEPKYDMSEAWEHHKKNNPHHWETWTKQYSQVSHQSVVNCIHMVIDWMAMSYKFGDTPRSYYEKNKDRIELPDEGIKLIYQIFERLES